MNTKKTCLALCVLSIATLQLRAQTNANLITNPEFGAKPDQLTGWRSDFPSEAWYVANSKYVSASTMEGKSCVRLLLPPGIAGNQGGKIESGFVKAEPGAVYRVSVDCMTGDFGAKLHAEAWTHDPDPAKSRNIFRVPADGGHPALVMCYRAQLPDPPAKSHQWTTVSREFTLPETVVVGGEDQKPEYLSVKAVVYAGTHNGGSSWFTNFRLTRVR